MGLSGVYNDAVSEDVAASLIKHAFSKGITFFDTSDFYGAHANEVLVGKVLLLLQLNTLARIHKYYFIFIPTMLYVT
jgi:predicted oxidoreductase